MHDLTDQMVVALTDLFMAAGGEVGHFCVVKPDDLPIFEKLFYHRLVVLEDYEAGQEQRYTAALTDDGRRFFAEYSQLEEDDIRTLPVRETINLTFNLRDESEARLYQQLQDMGKAGTLFNTLQRLLELDRMIASGDVDALLKALPEVSQKLRGEIEAHLVEQEQRQMKHLLAEIESVKAMLKQQPVAPPNGAAAHTPAPRPSVLRHVVPLAPPDSALPQLDVPQFEVPKYNDEEDSDLFVVQHDEDAGKKANENFLKSLFGLQEDQQQ